MIHMYKQKFGGVRLTCLAGICTPYNVLYTYAYIITPHLQRLYDSLIYYSSESRILLPKDSV